MSRIDEALSKANRKRRISEAHGSGVYKVLLEKSAPAKRKKPWILFIVFAILLGIGFYYNISKDMPEIRPKSATVTETGKTLPDVKHAAPTRLPEQENRIPSNILTALPDPEYSAAHPGWQRYETNALEYRVFREGKKVKAIQVISKRENAITAAFFDSFINEIADKEPFRVQSHETRGASFVEKGVVSKRAEVVIYRKRPAGEIKAFVVAYL
jgi:hypothetical protein